jgi:hypothetical protein
LATRKFGLNNGTAAMSALGQKQTCAVQNGMSALPQKADMCVAKADVRYGPKADIAIIR